MASYTYTSRTNYLSRLDYGNGNRVQYTYDTLGRVTTQTYEDGDKLTYKYNNDGDLASVYDSAIGRTTSYIYDGIGRLIRLGTENSGLSYYVKYGYDSINNLTTETESINGSVRTTSYTYDNDNRVTSITTGSAARQFAYDAFSRNTTRTTKNGSSTVLTDTFTYKAPSSTQTSGQVATMKNTAAGYNKTYTYTYDNNGNILSVNDGSTTTSYVYDSANQLTRENNQAAGKAWVYTYDKGGNITSKKEYAYTTGTLGSVQSTKNYTYGNSDWGDLLTAYSGSTVTSDTIGNMLSDGSRTFTWEHGRQLKTLAYGGTTWNFTYATNGLRTARTGGSTTYGYIYNGSQLSQMTVGSNTLKFTYANGSPVSVTYNGTIYYYVTNLQGDITAILNTSGAAVVNYTYDAWGNILTTTGSMASTLGVHNPLRYRGYVYDREYGLYYLQSRYYNPAMGRFISADAFTSTGQGLLGNNMFAYCGNNPVLMVDSNGKTFSISFGITINIFGWGGAFSVSFVSSEENMGIQTTFWVNDCTSSLNEVNQTIGIEIGPTVAIQYTEKKNIFDLEGAATSLGGDCLMGIDVVFDENNECLGWQWSATPVSMNSHKIRTETNTIVSFKTINLFKIITELIMEQ